jgi:O-antigen ligase
LRGLWGIALLVALPIAILATKTRAVWFSFAVSLAVLALRSPSKRIRRLCGVTVFAGILAVAFVAITSTGANGVLKERLEDRNTVDFRMAAYRAGWEMFLERPWMGWGTHQIRAELSDRIEGFQGDVFVVHNTYFEVALEHGLLGLVLYCWIIFELFRLGQGHRSPRGPDRLLSAASWPLWPLLLSVYFVNATFVVMNYQFVNGLLFTFAGIVARQRYQADTRANCTVSDMSTLQ